MLNKNMSKSEMEAVLSSKGNFTKIDYLTRVSKENLPFDVKRFVYQSLANIYEKSGMFVDAAKVYHNLAVISIAFNEKIKNHIKEAQFYIKAGKFVEAEEAIKKSMSHANEFQKQDIFHEIKSFYKKQAHEYENERKYAHATRLYEKILEMETGEIEKKQTKEKLILLYERLGKFKESKRLRGLK